MDSYSTSFGDVAYDAVAWYGFATTGYSGFYIIKAFDQNGIFGVFILAFGLLFGTWWLEFEYFGNVPFWFFIFDYFDNGGDGYFTTSKGYI